MKVRARSLIAAAGVTLLLSGCTGANDSSADQADNAAPDLPMAVVLPASESHTLLGACDGTRTEADSLWTSPDSVLRTLEIRLGQHLATDSASHAATDPLRPYSRQYLGIYRDGKRLVLINGVHEDYLERVMKRDSAHAPEDVRQWFQSNAIQMCDGGRMFFRAEYDVDADTITSFTYNGLS